MDAEVVFSMMPYWGMPVSMSAQASEWVYLLETNSYYAKAFLVPQEINGIQMLVVAVSTPESCAFAKQNYELQQAGMRIEHPEYFYYEVYVYPNVVLFNWYDLYHTGQHVPGKLVVLLDQLCAGQGILNWKSAYQPDQEGYFNANLRRLFGDLGVYHWIELTSGLSWHGYRCLDCYTRVHTRGMPPPDYEAWDLLGMDVAVEQRVEPRADDWWRYSVRWSMGQRSIVAEWYQEKPCGFELLMNRYVPALMPSLQEVYQQCQEVDYVMKTEYQGRGTPHCHIAAWIVSFGLHG